MHVPPLRSILLFVPDDAAVTASYDQWLSVVARTMSYDTPGRSSQGLVVDRAVSSSWVLRPSVRLGAGHT